MILILILLVTDWSSEELINLITAQRLLIHLPTPSALHHLLSGIETKHQGQTPGKSQWVLCISDDVLGFLVLSWFTWPKFLGLIKVERINHQDGLSYSPFPTVTKWILEPAIVLIASDWHCNMTVQSNSHTTISDVCHGPWRGEAFMENTVSNCRKWVKITFPSLWSYGGLYWEPRVKSIGGGLGSPRSLKTDKPGKN